MSYPSDLEYPRRVVVDDTDARVKYEGEWSLDVGTFDNLGIFGPPYNHSMHGTTQNSASFSFAFEGVYSRSAGRIEDSLSLPDPRRIHSSSGSKRHRRVTRDPATTRDNATVLAKWTCQVDGSAIRKVEYRSALFDLTHNVLCEQGRLSRQPHTLTVNVTVDDPNTQMFWLDKIEYVPNPDANLANEVMKIDGSDPSIRYDNNSGSWKPIGILFNGTGTTGASLSLDFNGTGVSLYGFNEGSDKHWQGSSGRYYVDNSGDTTFEIPESRSIPGLPNNLTDYYHELLFTTPQLNPGSHEMVITFSGVKNGDDPLQWLSIDYFYITASEGGAQLNTTSTTAGSLPTRDSDSSSNSGSSTSDKTPVGPIVGGVIGGIAGLALLGFAISFFLRRRNAQNRAGGYYDSVPFNPNNMYATPGAAAASRPAPTLNSGHTPYSDNSVYSTPTSPPPAGAHDHISQGFDPYSDDHAPGSVYSGSNSNSANSTSQSYGGFTVANPGPTTAPAPNQNWADLKSAQRDAVSTGPPIERRHQDSGVRYPQHGQIIDVPPNYTEQ
uniref:Transmembrane protein n=1 Tax=Moniliophthora roreri TaxID=221103 RepID=A0A0W0F163_MONRR